MYKKNEQDLLIELHYIKGPVTLPDGTTIQVEHDHDKPLHNPAAGSDQATLTVGLRLTGLYCDSMPTWPEQLGRSL